MKIAGDTHTHTLLCQHAYSTLLENIQAAAAAGHRFLATTEHGPAMPGAPHDWYFENLRKAVPRELLGVVVIKGCEANIMDQAGTLDVPEAGLKKLDLVIASMHRVTFPQDTTPEERTAAWRGVAKNPRVDIIGHLGDPRFKSDYEAAVRAFREGGQRCPLLRLYRGGGACRRHRPKSGHPGGADTKPKLSPLPRLAGRPARHSGPAGRMREGIP